MARHTAEPWRLGSLESYDGYTGKPYRNVWAGQGDDAIVVARCIDNGNCDEDATRIVASVNACVDIPTHELVGNHIAVRLAEWHQTSLNTVDQRDTLARTVRQLRQALAGLIDIWETLGPESSSDEGLAMLEDRMQEARSILGER